MKQNNKQLLLLIALLLQGLVTVPCWILGGFFLNNLWLEALTKILPIVALSFGAFLILRVRTLKNSNEVYEILTQQQDQLFFEVQRKIEWNIFIFAFVILLVQTYFSLLFLWDEYMRKPIVAAIPILMMAGLYIWFWFVLKHILNDRILVGHRVLVVSDEKGRVTCYKINELADVEQHYHHRFYAAKYHFTFPKGIVTVREDGFYNRCLIAVLKDSFTNKSQTIMGGVGGEFSEGGRCFTIANGDRKSIEEDATREIPWKEAEKDLAKSVRGEALFTCIGLSALILILGCVVYGILVAAIGFRIGLSVGYWLLCLLVLFACTRNERAGSTGTIYEVKGTVVCKKEVIRKEFWKANGFFVDVETDSGRRIEDVTCADPFFLKIMPGVTKARVVKSEKSKPWIYYDESDIDGTSGNGTPKTSDNGTPTASN